MYHAKSIAAVLVATLLLSLFSPIVSATGEKAPSTWSVLQPADMASFGNATISTPVMEVHANDYPDAQDLQTGTTTAISVISPRPGDYSALIINDSVSFISVEAARSFMLKAAAIERSSLPDTVATDFLNEALKRTLLGLGVEVHAVRKLDGDGLALYDALLQRGAFVSAMRIMVFATTLTVVPNEGSDEDALAAYNSQLAQKMNQGTSMFDLADLDRAMTVGAELTNHAIRTLLDSELAHGATGDISIRLDRSRSSFTSPEWYGTATASFWRHLTDQGQTCSPISSAESCHHLATWTRPYGNSPHYLGSGGDSATCWSNHGCISQWSWWLTTPESRLGVPKTFYFLGSWGVGGGGNNINNYSASVWYD